MEPDTELEQMCATYPDIDLEEEGANKEQQKTEAETTKHIAALSAHWQTEHAGRTRQIEKQLLKERGQATADERLLVALAAHDCALAELLGQSELQLAKRLRALVDNVKVGVQLARTLKEVSTCRESATRRLQSLLQAAAVLRGQRRLANVVPLRKVA